MKRPIFVALVIISLTGCAPMAVNLSGSDNLVDRKMQSDERFDYKLVVLNRAPETKMDQKIFGTSTIPMRTEVTPQTTLENDIKRYFENVTKHENDDRKIVARIDKADAYWMNPGTNTIPIVGLFTSFASRYPFVFDISITFEVKENGQVVKTWPFTQKVEILDGNASTPSNIEESYQRLIAKYRGVMFDSISNEFIPRYLSKSPMSVETARRDGFSSATVGSPNSTTISASKVPTIDKLKELDSMHREGLINDNEYASKKKAILDAM